MNRFEGRRVLITGAGSGIGQATVHRILAEGGTVVAADVVEAGLETTRAQAVKDGTDARLTTRLVDISDEASVRAGVGGAIAELGGLDVVVNAAGILRSAHTEQTTLFLDLVRFDTLAIGRRPVSFCCRACIAGAFDIEVDCISAI